MSATATSTSTSSCPKAWTRANSTPCDAGAKVVHDLVHRYEGSISAEHGLGRMKTQEALLYKDPVAVEAMRAVRLALDPKRIMNPHVLF